MAPPWHHHSQPPTYFTTRYSIILGPALPYYNIRYNYVKLMMRTKDTVYSVMLGPMLPYYSLRYNAAEVRTDTVQFLVPLCACSGSDTRYTISHFDALLELLCRVKQIKILTLCHKIHYGTLTQTYC